MAYWVVLCRTWSAHLSARELPWLNSLLVSLHKTRCSRKKLKPYLCSSISYRQAMFSPPPPPPPPPPQYTQEDDAFLCLFPLPPILVGTRKKLSCTSPDVWGEGGGGGGVTTGHPGCQVNVPTTGIVLHITMGV